MTILNKFEADDVYAIKQVLTKVRVLMANPATWTQRTSARGAEGAPVEPKDPSARCFCVFGATHREAPSGRIADLTWEYLDTFVPAVVGDNTDSLIDFNDGRRIHQGIQPRELVLKVIDAAIAA